MATSPARRWVGVGVLATLGYAWFTAGVRPFTAWAYVVVAVPVAVMLALYARHGGFSDPDVAQYYRQRSLGSSRGEAPWWVLFIVALALEIVGLALGGHSKDVPTLSTTIDHLLVAHWGRWLLFLWWVWVGARAAEGARQQRRETMRS